MHSPYRSRRLLAFTPVLALAAGLLAAAPVHAAPARGPDTAVLDRLLADQFARSAAVPGIAARVQAPGLSWAGAVGTSDRATGTPLRPYDTFRIASVTKTFTAAATLALVDRRQVAVDTPIAAYLPAEYQDLLRRGGYRPDVISVRHLLTHTSGLYDYGTDERYQQAALNDPNRRWTPVEQVTWAMEHGTAYGRPGERFRYSDTGYVLLARIIETATGLPQAAAYRKLLCYDRLGLTDTWFETLEPAPPTAGRRAHQYFVVPAAGIDIDTYRADPSFDLYGGGGLVSSVADLTRFYRALLAGDVISRPALRMMLTPVATGHNDKKAGMGIFPATINGTTCWWHNGFFGTAVLYCPDHRLSVALTTNAHVSDGTTPGAMTNAIALATTTMELLLRT